MSDCILVTGGGGFIGRHLVEALLRLGGNVRVLDQRRPAVAWQRDVDWAIGDIRDAAFVRRSVGGCRQVYHLAANPQLWTRRKGHFRAVNYEGTRNVLDAAIAAGVERILHTSTESILTRIRQTTAIAEDQQVPPNEVIGPYCRSKYDAEQHAFRRARGGAAVVIVNPTLPIGPGDFGRSPPTQMLLDCCNGKRPAYLDAGLNLIDARDVALGMIAAMQHGQPGRRYLLGAENWTIRQLFEWVARHTGQAPPRWRVPYPVALAVALVSEWIADVATGQIPAATVTGVRLTQRRMHFDARRSLAELGLLPRPVEQSLAEAIEWYRLMGWCRH